MTATIRRRLIEGEITVGDSFSVTRTFTGEDVHLFTDVSNDHNPVHSNREYAKGKGLDGLICHGLHVGSLMSEIGGQLAMLASGMNFRFRLPVYFSDTVTCTLTIDEMDERGRVKCSAIFVNQRDETVIEGQLFGILPNAEERALLAPPSV